MEFALEIRKLESIHPRADLMSVEDFQTSLKERADEREESMLRGVSIDPLRRFAAPTTRCARVRVAVPQIQPIFSLTKVFFSVVFGGHRTRSGAER
jgi:hypothetical protein